MKYILFLTGLFFFQITNAQLKERNLIIGSVYHSINELSIFKGYKEEEGTLIGNNGFSISMIAKGKYTVVLLEKVVSNKPVVEYKILDYNIIGNVTSTQNMIISHCLLNKKNADVIALVRNNNKGYYNHVLKAWRINLNTTRIEKISPLGVTCVDENYCDTD